ncbi:hypothetical protein [Streptomyces sp. Act143]|uniref:hypothetical protein n=1 Tax=Streptomyces sp. Act143 TaxID=2200760 RepID=UPI0035C12709
MTGPQGRKGPCPPSGRRTAPAARGRSAASTPYREARPPRRIPARTVAPPPLGKNVTTDALLAGIRTVAAGEALLSPPFRRAMTELGARDRARLAVIAYPAGLVRPASGPR